MPAAPTATQRSTFVSAALISTSSPASARRAAASSASRRGGAKRRRCSASSRSGARAGGAPTMWPTSRSAALPVRSERFSSRSRRPTTSARRRIPFAAISSRTSRATCCSSRVTCRLLPVKRATSAGSCVATPSVQPWRRLPVVSPGCGPAMWHWRSIEQPIDISSAGAEADPVGAEQHQLERVLAGQDAAVDGELDALADALLDQHVLHRRQHRRHRHAAVLLVDALGGAGAAAAVREVQPVGAGVDAAHARHLDAVRRHELERGAHVGVEVAPALDHQLDVLDRVEVVVHGRRDELVARLAAALLRDARGDLLARQLAALAGLGALRELDLGLGRARGGHRRDREARARVLDAAVAVGAADAGLVEAALAGVRDRADARRNRHARAAELREAVAVERVHRPRDRAVRGLRRARPRSCRAP